MTPFVLIAILTLTLLVAGCALMLDGSEGEVTFRLFGALFHVFMGISIAYWLFAQPQTTGGGIWWATIVTGGLALAEVLYYGRKLRPQW